MGVQSLNKKSVISGYEKAPAGTGLEIQNLKTNKSIMLLYEKAPAGNGLEIEVRGCPHAVFDPWVRWNLGLAQLGSFRVCRRCHGAQICRNGNEKICFLQKSRN